MINKTFRSNYILLIPTGALSSDIGAVWPSQARSRGRRRSEYRSQRSPGQLFSQGLDDNNSRRTGTSHEPPKLECERLTKSYTSPKGRLPKTQGREGSTRESASSGSSLANTSSHSGQWMPSQHSTFHTEGTPISSTQHESSRRNRALQQKVVASDQSAAYSSDTVDSEPPELEMEAPLMQLSEPNTSVTHSVSSTTSCMTSSTQKSSVEASTETETPVKKAPLCEIGIQAEPEAQPDRDRDLLNAPKECIKKNVDVGVQVDPAEALALMAAAEKSSMSLQIRQSEVAVQATQTDQGTDPMVPLEIQVDFDGDQLLTSRRSQGQSPMSTRSPRLKSGSHQTPHKMSPSICSPRSTGASHSPVMPRSRCPRSPLVTSPNQTSPGGNSTTSVSAASPARHSRNGSPRGRPRKSTAVCVSPDTTVSSPPQLSLHSPGSQSDSQMTRNSQYSRPRRPSLSPKCRCDLEQYVGTTSQANGNSKQHSIVQNCDLSQDSETGGTASLPGSDSRQGTKQPESQRQHNSPEENVDVCVIEDSDRDVIIIDEDDDDTGCGQCAQLQRASTKQAKKRGRGRPRKHGSRTSRPSHRPDSECEMVEISGSGASLEVSPNKKKKKHSHRASVGEISGDVEQPTTSKDTTPLDLLSSFPLFKEPSLFVDDVAAMHKAQRSDYEPLPQLKKRRRRVDDDMGYSKPRRKRRKKRYALVSTTEDESTAEEPEAR